MFKKIFIFLISFLLTFITVILAYLWDAPRNSDIIKPFFPKTLFSIENSPKDSLTGEVSSISGNVAWQSRSSNYATLINSNIKLQQGEEVITHDNGKSVISFSKVGTFTLFPNTQLSFIQTLPVNFVIEQDQGLATYDKTSDTKLSVRSLDLLININSGTSTISVDKDSADIQVSVNSGSVSAAFNDTNNQTNIIIVEEGKKFIFNNNTKTGRIRNL